MSKLTIVVPVYKVEKYIEKCVDSILSQDYKGIEVLLIDDGSPDNCPAICDRYAKNDYRVRVIHQKNAGLAEARNVGIRECVTEYIGFVDSDDFILPGMLSTMMGKIEKDPETDIVICDYNTFYDDDYDRMTEHHQNIDPHWSSEKIRDKFLMDEYPNYMWNKIYRKSLFDEIEIPKGMTMEDLFACAEVFARAKNIKYVNKAYSCYRLHRSTFSNMAKVLKKHGLFLAWREHERVCNELNLKPLAYSRLRARKAAISLKIINYAEPMLNDCQLEELNEYLSEIKDIDDLPIKYRFELWADKNMPRIILKYLGMMSVYCEKRKQL